MFQNTSGGKKTALWLGLILVLALTLRIVFNMGVAYDEEGERYLYSGNDPWYHDRTVDHILETGESLTTDPAINYPNGGRNPNPPLYDWTTAVDAKAIEMAGGSDPSGLALNLAVGFWGALTIIPLYFIGRDLFGRRAGLWGAFFVGVSAPHIQRSVFGFADHDATAVFFIVSTVAFMVRAFQTMQKKEYVDDWRDGAMADIRRGFAENKEALLYAALAGVALAATALTWKGYPYVLGFLAFAFGFQLLIDHMRNKDSTVITAIYLIPILLSLLMIWPYYGALNLGSSTIGPQLYVLVGMLVAAAILVPTRDLPSIVVFPATLLAAILGLLVLLFVAPEMGQRIFTGLGYFEQTKLYSTIAEAQRTELGFVAANLGFFTFLLALWGFGRTVRLGVKGDAAMLLTATWALVAGFLAFAASRFVMHAAVVLLMLAGAATSWILATAGFDEVARRKRQLHGQGGAIGNSFKAMTGKATGITVLVAGLLVLPNVWLGVDAALSSEFEDEHGLSDKALGAFGISFDIDDSGWLGLFDHLAMQDTEIEDIGDRPGFIAWWDYGHWATSIGNHPTVADPFQNHFEAAGRFLASESEEEATFWMAILLTDANKAEAFPVLASHGVDTDAYRGDYDDRYAAVTAAVANETAYELYEDLVDVTGQEIGYMGVDSRMYPLSQFQSGIFYAPAFLANKNPDDFLSYTYAGEGLQLSLQQYGVDENGDSYRLDAPRFLDTNGNDWIVVQNQAFRGTEIPLTGADEGIPVQGNLQTTQAFRDSMYARAYGSPDPNTPPGDGLTHWMAIYDGVNSNNDQEFRATTLLEYFRGHTISGRVVDDLGMPLTGVDVTFVDQFGAAHDEATTDDSGAFSVLAPHGELELTVRVAGNAIHSQEWTQPESEDGGSTDGVTVTVPRGSLVGQAYHDADGDQTFSEGDTPLAGAKITVGAMETFADADGNYELTGLTAGSYSIRADAHGYQPAGNFVIIAGGEQGVGDIHAVPLPSDVTVTLRADGEPAGFIPVAFEGPEDRFATTDENGTLTISLVPGQWTVIVDEAIPIDGEEVVYDVRQALNVPFGGDAVTLTVNL